MRQRPRVALIRTCKWTQLPEVFYLPRHPFSISYSVNLDSPKVADLDRFANWYSVCRDISPKAGHTSTALGAAENPARANTTYARDFGNGVTVPPQYRRCIV